MALDESHTEESLIDLAECGYQFSAAILNSLLAPLHSQWNFPKHHLLLCHLLHARTPPKRAYFRASMQTYNNPVASKQDKRTQQAWAGWDRPLVHA